MVTDESILAYAQEAGVGLTVSSSYVSSGQVVMLRNC